MVPFFLPWLESLSLQINAENRDTVDSRYLEVEGTL